MRPVDVDLLALISASTALSDHIGHCPEEGCPVKDMLLKAGMIAAVRCARCHGVDPDRITDAESAVMRTRECFEQVVQQAAIADGTLSELLAAATIAVDALVVHLRELDPRVEALRN